MNDLSKVSIGLTKFPGGVTDSKIIEICIGVAVICVGVGLKNYLSNGKAGKRLFR